MNAGMYREVDLCGFSYHWTAKLSHFTYKCVSGNKTQMDTLTESGSFKHLTETGKS